MQVKWLMPRLRNVLRVISGINVGAISGIVAYFCFRILGNDTLGVIGGLSFAIGGAVTFGLVNTLPVDKVLWKWSTFLSFKHWLNAIRIGTIFGVSFGTIMTVIIGLDGMDLGILLGLTSIIMIGIVGSMEEYSIQARTYANE